MSRLTETSVEDLQRALDAVTEKKPAQRLIAAIAYKHGTTQSELATWFGVERKTIYNWLTRLESADLESAVHDADRPGRPRKLRGGHHEELISVLQEPPTSAGYSSPAWTTQLAQEYVQDEFDVDYSTPSCRRLMTEAGLRPITKRHAVTELDLADHTVSDVPSGRLWIPE